MRATGWVPRVLLALFVFGGLLLARGFSEQTRIAHAATFTVNSIGDGVDQSAGNGVCETSTSSECTLRAAIEEANALSGADTINFNVGGGGLETVVLGSALPNIASPMTIDGTTQPGWVSPIPLINISGSGLPLGADALYVTVSGSGSTIKGLTISFFPSEGIELNYATGVLIDGNSIGGDPNELATDTGQGGSGIQIVGGAGNTIGDTIGNLISQNGTGIAISGSTGNVIRNNKIGTNYIGTVDRGNDSVGVYLYQASDAVVGGSGVGNVISGNGSYGVGIVVDSDDVRVLGNYIGTNAAGTAAITNSGGGVLMSSSDSAVIGGTSVAARNIISGNGAIGVSVDGTGTQVLGNYIGTNAAGTSAIPNTIRGVDVGGDGNFIGGSAPGEGNLISGNSFGGMQIFSGADNNVVAGNLIGTTANGLSSLPNGLQGVRVDGAGTTIGGTIAGARNVISGNNIQGLYITAGPTTIRGNYVGIRSNGTGGLGNGNSGIYISAGPATIGGGGTGGRNIISSNGNNGILINGNVQPITITGNYIGVEADGTTSAGNLAEGIEIQQSTFTTIGRVNGDDGNIIANNNVGLLINDFGGTANNNVIRGNNIYANATLGIDLIGGGANNGIAAPTIVAPLPPHGTTCALCTVDVYSDSADEGRYYEGTVTADGSGNWAFNGTVTGANVTATTTSGLNTSEFSAPFAVSPCAGICTAGVWRLDFIDTAPPVTNHYCTSSVTQSGANSSWGEISCQDGLLEVYGATLTPNPDVTPNNNALTANIVGPGGLLSTSTGTYSDDGNSASGTWTCTAVCTDSGTWTGTRLGANVTVPANVPTSLGSGVPSATITTPSGSPAITVQAAPLENVSGGFLRTGYDFQPHGLTFDPSNPVRLDVFYNPVTDLPAGTDCRHIAHYRYDPLTGTSTFQSRVRCGTNNSFTVPITGFSVHRFEIGRDTDGDGVDDGTDVCPLVSDPAQTHSDAQILVLPGPDDWTVPYGDDSGDACDTDGDKDNDGLTDTQEAAGCGYGPTSATNRDSDGDLFIDAAECALNKNPNSISIKPLMAQCGAGGDLDGDGLLNQVEYCKYGTDPNNANSDRQHFNISDDTCDDGREAANVNANYSVNVLDLGAVAAQATGTYALPPTPTKLNFDFNRNGSIDVLDLAAVAAKATPSNFNCQLWPTLP